MTQPNDGAVQPDSPPEPTSPSRRTIIVAAAVGAVALGVVISIVVVAVMAFNANREPETFEVLGAITLEDSITTYGLPDGFECAGKGGYKDIGPGAAVTVTDEAGTLLAKGAIATSSGGSSGCWLDFTVADVPRGKAFYKVEVSHRGELTYTESEAESGLVFSLG
ncbi:hypothetical protein [Rhodococcus sp. 14-2470-1a]|uniref:hypothetical protein n=1 Tax=Rhodococcus sp. 14-2470-1a TaxID=2023150 RepID=UPI000B9B55A1|nr:hypothetical protein [Rhodococcus sp. 14-2470-1a]OZF49695.1 hypothetical protein CH292_14180 [Rhodococcus sp. 14-2470-1a]